jgi:hypothetical protein
MSGKWWDDRGVTPQRTTRATLKNVLLGGVLVATAADICLTVAHSGSNPLNEQNPVMRFALKNLGVGGFVAAKVAGTLLVCDVIRRLPGRSSTVCAAGLLTWISYAAMTNVFPALDTVPVGLLRTVAHHIAA